MYFYCWQNIMYKLFDKFTGEIYIFELITHFYQLIQLFTFSHYRPVYKMYCINLRCLFWLADSCMMFTI